jgi:hypothetical protein
VAARRRDRRQRPLAEALRVTRRSIAIRYLAYALMIAAVIAGLVGALERDGQAEAATTAGEARIDYPRVTRQGLKPTLVVEVVNRTRRPQEPALVISSEYLESVQLAGLSPDPVESGGTGDGLVEFRFAPLGAEERLRAVLAFSIDHQAPGARFETPVRVVLGSSLLLDADISTVVLP